MYKSLILMAVFFVVSCSQGEKLSTFSGIKDDYVDAFETKDFYSGETKEDVVIFSDSSDSSADDFNDFEDDFSDFGDADYDYDKNDVVDTDLGTESDDNFFDIDYYEFDFFVTVNDIPEDMNGSTPFLDNDKKEKSFFLLLPQNGFEIDIVLRDDWAVPVGVDVFLDVSTSKFSLNENIGSLFQFDGEKFFYFVNDDTFPEGKVTVRATLKFDGGIKSVEKKYVFFVEEMKKSLDPFFKPDVWLVDFSRDIEENHLEFESDGSLKLVSTYLEDGNGIPDFKEVLFTVGLLGSNEEFNQKMEELIFNEIRKKLHKIFLLNEDGSFNQNSVHIKFYFDFDPDAPDPSEFDKNGDFSMIAVGSDGTPEEQEDGYVGMAFLDWNNQSKEDNTGYGYGCFITALFRKFVENPFGKAYLKSILPGLGTPFGEYSGDIKFFDPDFDENKTSDSTLKSRYKLFKTLTELGTKGIAALIAHEIGHSLGLVPNGAPPSGLFGGIKYASFVVSPSTSHHIDTKGLNIMQTGKDFNFSEVFDEPHFSPLNRAYLQRRIIVDKNYSVNQ